MGTLEDFLRVFHLNPDELQNPYIKQVIEEQINISDNDEDEQVQD